MALQRRAEVRKKSKIKKILADQPLKKEKEITGLTETQKKAAVGTGMGKRSAKKTKKYVKKLGKEFKKGFKKSLDTGITGMSAYLGFIEEMLPRKKGKAVEAMQKMNKGGPVDARKIAKKYFKGTF